MKWEARKAHRLSGLIHRKMLTDRRPLLTTLADKLACRDYISDLVGSQYLATLLGSGPSTGSIDWRGLPPTFVAKVNHGSGGVIVVADDADPRQRLPTSPASLGWVKLQVMPEHVDVDVIAEICRSWMTQDYSWAPGRRSVEWCYEGIPRKVFVEELLRDDRGLPPQEYRLFVIGGRVRFLQVESVESGIECIAVMSPEWEWLPARFLNPAPSIAPDGPTALPEMISVAERLARPVGDFLRVDLYDLGSRIVVGELTNYPYGGRLPVRPRSFDEEWAKHWPR